nr:LuxR C-terminal-related transcriptional regulator [Hyphomicrobium nitrativorans]
MKVLDMVSQGLSNKEIAFRLGVREGTVKAHMGSILRKLGVSSRTKLAIEISKLQTAAARSRSNVVSDESKPS